MLRFLLLEHRGLYNGATTYRSVWTATNPRARWVENRAAVGESRARRPAPLIFTRTTISPDQVAARRFIGGRGSSAQGAPAPGPRPGERRRGRRRAVPFGFRQPSSLN